MPLPRTAAQRPARPRMVARPAGPLAQVRQRLPRSRRDPLDGPELPRWISRHRSVVPSLRGGSATSMGGEADRRSGEPTTTARSTTSPSAPAPGRSTLVQALSQPPSAPAADIGGSTQVQMLPQADGAPQAGAAGDAAQGDALLQGGVARVEGDTLFCPPDGALSTVVPSEASTAPKKTDA